MSSSFASSGTAPLILTAENFSVATGEPVQTVYADGSRQYSAWSFSGEKTGESVAGVVTGLPADCCGVKVEIVVNAAPGENGTEAEDVYRVCLSQGTGEISGVPVRNAVTAGLRTIGLEAYCAADPRLPLTVRIERLSGDPADTFPLPTELIMARIQPVEVPARDFVVQDVPGYNSWPMIQAIGNTLVCAYTRGSAHDIGEPCRGVYARTSADGGATWSPEVTVSNDPKCGEVTIGKGLDENGAMLLWVRSWGAKMFHTLYRTADGVNFERVAVPALNPVPMQITDIFHVPTVGLMALWFAGNYHDDALNAWGTLISRDNGATWEQRVMESGMPKAEWATEPSAIYLGDGRIFVIARTECVEPTTRAAQFQLESTDYGKTWTRSRTNIGDVSISTPSLIYDKATGLVSNYYFQRGRGVLKRRVVRIDDISGHPLRWPDPEIVALGSTAYLDAGNVNAVSLNGTHFLAYYSGVHPDTAIIVSAADAP